jgi:hypothetical protein
MHLTTAFLPGLGFQLVPSESHYLNLNRRYSNRNLLQVGSYGITLLQVSSYGITYRDIKIEKLKLVMYLLFEFFECIEFYQFLKYV